MQHPKNCKFLTNQNFTKMKTETTKKAEKAIKELTKKESSTFNYLLRLMSETLEHYMKCEKELQYQTRNEGAERYTQAMKTAHEKTFTLGYIAQCLGFQITPDWTKEDTILIDII